MSLSTTLIYSESLGKNINRVYYYNSDTAPFGLNTGSSGYVGALQNGQMSFLTQPISTKFTDAIGNTFDNASWQAVTASYDVYDDYTGQVGYVLPAGANKLYLGATGTTAATWVGGAAIESRYRWGISGNFDVELDFSNFNRETAGVTECCMNISIIGQQGARNHYAYAQVAKYNDGNTYFVRFLNTTGTQGYYVNVNMGPAVNSGSLRVTRIDNTASFYYKTGSINWWEKISGDLDVTDNIGNEDIFVKLEQHSYDFVQQNINISNFKIVSGTFVTSSGWYEETGSHQRNPTFKSMPSNILSIGNDSGVELYDVDHNEMWMRFYTGSENFFHLSGVGNQRPLDFSWSPYGQLYCAYGSVWQGIGTTPQDGGLMNINFSAQGSLQLRLHNNTGSSTISTGTFWGYTTWQNYSITQNPIKVRNDNHGFSSGSSTNYKSNWGVQNSCVLSVDTYIPPPSNGTSYDYTPYVDPMFWAAANEDGLRVFKMNVPTRYRAWKPKLGTGSSDHIIANGTRYMYCKFDQDNGDFHFVTQNDIYYISYTNLSSSFTSSTDTSIFTYDSKKQLLGTRGGGVNLQQFRFGRDGSKDIYIPAEEGIYKIDKLLTSQQLFIADIGGQHNIVPSYDSINIIKTTYPCQGNKDYIVYGCNNGTDYRLGFIKLNGNSTPRLVLDNSVKSLSGSSEIKDIDVWKTVQYGSNKDVMYGWFAFTSSIYQFQVDLPLQEGVTACSDNAIASDFQLRHYECLPYQHLNPAGASLRTVPYVLGSPWTIIRNRLVAPSSSLGK